jgi:hypothetical protein
VGWARADVRPDGSWTDLRHGITPLRDMALAAHASIVDGRYDVVVMEDWKLFPAMAAQFIGSGFPSVQFIGAVRLCCWVSGTKLVMQGAATKKPTLEIMQSVDPELYAKVTQPIKHDDGHDLDALIHLFRWTWKNTSLVPPRKAAA